MQGDLLQHHSQQQMFCPQLIVLLDGIFGMLAVLLYCNRQTCQYGLMLKDHRKAFLLFRHLVSALHSHFMAWQPAFLALRPTYGNGCLLRGNH